MKINKIFGILLISLLFFLVLNNNVKAIYYKDNCLNDTHLYSESSFSLNSEAIILNQTIECEHGCDTELDRCAGSDIERGFLLFPLVVLLLLIGYWIYRKKS